MAIAASLATSASAFDTLYVDDDAAASGDGTTWATAHRYLTDALTDAALSGGAVTAIHVAGGVYHPDESSASPPPGNGNRGAVFDVKNGVDIIGGFAGVGATDPDERDPQTYVTILSGDLADDDDSGGSNAENSYHVLYAVGSVFMPVTATLDGLVITAGNANSVSLNGRGGGMYTAQSVLSLVDCAFVGNHATRGGGMYTTQATLALIGSEFSGNDATDGGGMNCFQCLMTFSDCLVADNHASNGGGAYLQTSSWTLNDTVFQGNTAFTRGGGIYRVMSTDGTLVIEDCQFLDNSCSGLFGGGIDFTTLQPGVFINRTIFSGNSAQHGGALHNLSNGMTVVNCLFTGNNATNPVYPYGNGGGLAVAGSSEFPLDDGPHIINCTIAHNTSARTGAGIGTTSGNAAPIIMNCVIWGNTSNGITDESAQLDSSDVVTGPGPLVMFCDIEGLVAGGDNDSGSNVSNIGADPLFVDASGDNFRLTALSPCIDSGDAGLLPEGVSLDLDGAPRVVDGSGMGGAAVDIGAYEFFSFDSDGDGLLDDVEIAIGTDPFDPDTDDDGLLDGTEVDTANGTGCPDPLNPDSDADTLSDGDEVALGTSPCDPDTDGDGVDDATDPTPVDPGVTGDFFATMMLAAADYVESLDLSLFEGKNENAQEGRRNKLASNLRKAAKAMKDDDFDKAIGKLEKNLERIDGDDHPKDWMIDSPERDGLYADHVFFIQLAVLSGA